MTNKARLAQTLARIDGRGYPAYKDTRGAYQMEPGVTLFIDHVQGDPFAAPSKMRIRVDASQAQFPSDLFDTRVRAVALADFLTRQVHRQLGSVQGRRGSGKSGQMSIDVGRQAVLERTSILVNPDFVEARLQVGLPAQGRRIRGREAKTMLCQVLPQVALESLCWAALSPRLVRDFVDCIDNQDGLRKQLKEKGLVAFVANGSILPRASGVSQLPMDGAVPFEAPPELAITLELRHARPGFQGETQISGMGIPEGITLIVGGGYHGKSTLLHALQQGVYPHIPGDGREYVVSRAETMKVRAEDGRSVRTTNISGFIDNLPLGRETRTFTSDDASGSTSQAANIVEAVEVGATCLLLDEDTCATNFMIRDARMQALVAAEREPITPFLDRVRTLYEEHDVSTILVMGGCGDYFQVADRVLAMCEYKLTDVTAKARSICEEMPTTRQHDALTPFNMSPRIPLGRSIDASSGRRDVKIDARSTAGLRFGDLEVDLRALEQLIEPSQTYAVGYAIFLARRWMDGQATLAEVCQQLETFLDKEGVDSLQPSRRGDAHPGNFSRPRILEVSAALNRLRNAKFRAT